MLLFHSRDIIANDDDTLIFLHTSDIYNTINFGNLCRFFRFSCLKQLSNTRKTTGNVLRLDSASRNTSEERTSLDMISFVNTDNSPRRQGISTHKIFERFVSVDGNLRV